MKIKYTTKEPELRVGMKVSIDVDNINYAEYNKMYNIGSDIERYRSKSFKVEDLKATFGPYPAVKILAEGGHPWYIPKELLIIKSK